MKPAAPFQAFSSQGKPARRDLTVPFDTGKNFKPDLAKLASHCNKMLLEYPNRTTDMEMAKLMKNIDRLLELISRLAKDEFTGYIKINFTQGGVGRVEKYEEILKLKNLKD